MNLGFRKGAASIDKAIDTVGVKWWWTNLIAVSMPFNCFLWAVCFLCAHMSPPEDTRVSFLLCP